MRSHGVAPSLRESSQRQGAFLAFLRKLRADLRGVASDKLESTALRWISPWLAESACLVEYRPASYEVQLLWEWPHRDLSREAAWPADRVRRCLDFPDRAWEEGFWVVPFLERRGRRRCFLLALKAEAREAMDREAARGLAQDLGEILRAEILSRFQERLVLRLQRVSRQLMRRLREEDVYYQILHCLDDLIPYDHSATLFLYHRERQWFVKKAETVAWRRGGSRTIGQRIAMPQEVLVWLDSAETDRTFEAARVAGRWGRYREKEGASRTWVPLEGKEEAVARSLALSGAPDDLPKNALLWRPIHDQGRIEALLVLAARDPDGFDGLDTETLERVAPTIASAIQTARERTRRKNELQLLFEVGRILASEGDRRKQWQNVLEHILDALQVEIGSINLVVPGEQELQVVAHRGYDVVPGPRWPRDRGIIGRAVQTRKPQRVNDVAQESAYAPFALAVRSELAVPILFQGEPLGVINVESRCAERFSAEDERFLEQLAEQLGIALRAIGSQAQAIRALEGQRLQKQVAQDLDAEIAGQTDLASLLHRAVEYAHDALGAEALLLYLRERDTFRLRAAVGFPLPDAPYDRFSLGEGFLGRVGALPAGENGPWVWNDPGAWAGDPHLDTYASALASGGIRHLAVARLQRSGRTIGLLCALNRRESRAEHEPAGFSDTEAAILASVAEELVRALRQVQRESDLRTILSLTQDAMALRGEGEIAQQAVRAIRQSRPEWLSVRLEVSSEEGEPTIICVDPPGAVPGPDDRSLDYRFPKESGVPGRLIVYAAPGEGFEPDDRAFLEAMAYQTAVLLANQRNFRRIRRQVRQLEQLQEVAMQLARGTALRETLDGVARQAMELGRADMVVIIPYAAQGERLLVADAVCRGNRTRPELTEETRPGGVSARLLRSRKGYLWVPDLQKAPHLSSAFLRREGVCSFLAVRLDAGERPVGLLFLDYREARQQPEGIDNIRTLASHAAVAIERARLVERLDSQLGVLRGLLQVVQKMTSDFHYRDVLDLLARAAVGSLKADMVVLYPYDVRHGVVESPLTAGDIRYPELVDPCPGGSKERVRRLIEQGKPIFAPEVEKEEALRGDFSAREGVRSAAFLPLPTCSDPEAGEFSRLGGMFLNYRKYHDFSREEQEICTLFADQAAIAVQLAKTIDRMQLAFTVSSEGQDVVLAEAIRGPLCTAKQAVELLYRDRLRDDPEKQRYWIEQAFQVLRAMEIQVKNLIWIANLAAGRSALNLEPLPADELLRAVEQEFGAWAEQKRIRLVVPSGVGVWIRADRSCAQQILSSLLDNALKFTPEGGQVCVEVVPGAEQVAFRVRDTGIGIPEAERAMIFGKFYRGKCAQAEHIPGIGLGLYLARQLAGRQGGEVRLLNPEGQGSTFELLLPRAMER